MISCCSVVLSRLTVLQAAGMMALFTGAHQQDNDYFRCQALAATTSVLEDTAVMLFIPFLCIASSCLCACVHEWESERASELISVFPKPTSLNFFHHRDTKEEYWGELEVPEFPTLPTTVTCEHLFYSGQYLFLSVLWRPSLDMSDQVLIEMSCQGGGEGARGVGLSLAGATGGGVGHRSTRCVWSCAQNLLAVGARKRIKCLQTVYDIQVMLQHWCFASLYTAEHAVCCIYPHPRPTQTLLILFCISAVDVRSPNYYYLVLFSIQKLFLQPRPKLGRCIGASMCGEEHKTSAFPAFR